MARRAPPALARWLLSACVPRVHREFVMGDVEEEYHEIASRRGVWHARRWYWRQVLGSIVAVGRSRSGGRKSSRGQRSRGSAGGSLAQDVRYAGRALRRGKGIIAVAIISLGIGIGANVTVFSAVEALLVRPMPYPDSQKLHVVWLTDPDRGPGFRVFYSVLDFVDLRQRSQTMGVAATQRTSFNVSGAANPERRRGSIVSSNIFDVLGVQPALGRGFALEEEQPGRSRVVVISHGLWQRKYGSDPTVLGSAILLDGVPHTVVGVMPPGFWFLYPGVDVWVPLAISGNESRHSQSLSLVGRLRGGTIRQQAEEEARLFAGQMALEFPEENSHCPSAVLESLHDYVYGPEIRAACFISIVAAAVVLLVVCANVANLLLTFGSGRVREVAIRSALGAGRARIARQFLTEAVMVSVAGALLGIGLSVYAIQGLQSLLPDSVARVDEIGLNLSVLLYTGGLSVLTGLFVGILPAVQCSEPSTVAMLSEGSRGGTGATRVRLRRVLVVGEVSLTFVLLVSMALLVRGFARVRLTDRGFDESDVLTLQVTLPERDYPDTAAVAGFYDALRSRMAAIAGVEAVGATNVLPLQLGNTTSYVLTGEDITNEKQRRPAYRTRVLPGYFAAMDIPVLRGRDVEERDRADMPRVMLIDETIAERHWPNVDPVGKQLELAWGPHEIVGVVADTRDRGLVAANERPNIYLSAYQSLWRSMSWVVETKLPPDRVATAIRNEIRSLDPNLPAYNIQPLATLIDESLGDETISMKIMSALALIALLLAVGGVYGVVAYSVSKRTRELGIRMALGADPAKVLALVMRQGTVLTVMGLLAGTGVAVGVTRGLSRFLFGVSPFDPASYAVAATVLLASGLAATYFPARQATKVSPLTAMRAE